MAGHSQFKNIMHRKGAQDAKRAKVFTKLIRELTVAARVSPLPENNPRLKAAMIAARDANMSKETMERAIKRGAGGDDQTNYEEVRYEGFGPGGVSIIVEALTDNRNRTASEIRRVFSKQGGALGEINSVAYNFERRGIVRYAASVASPDAMFEAALEAGADDVNSDASGHEVVTAPENLAQVRDALHDRFGAPAEARLTWRPTNSIPVDDGSQAESLIKLLDQLEDNDDVQSVAANFEIADDLMSRLTA
jgi:YebC/PmpR family DNA-binding regulatory protein